MRGTGRIPDATRPSATGSPPSGVRAFRGMSTTLAPATTPADITDAIEEAALAIAHEVVHCAVSPFVGHPRAYTLGAVTGDRAILAESLGREPTADECARCETAVPGAIEDALCAHADAVTE